MAIPHRPRKSVPTRVLPETPDLDQIKRQAKELLKAFRVGDRAAIDEIEIHYSDVDRTVFALHDAQLVIARAYGFESWPKLAKRVYPSRTRGGSNKPSQRMQQPWDMRGCEWLRQGVAVDGDQAWSMFCACADGELDTVRRLYDANPDLVHAELHYCKPIDFALRENHGDIVRFLLEQVPRLLITDVYGGSGVGIDIGRSWCPGYRINHEEVLRRGYNQLDQLVIDKRRSLAPHASEHYASLYEILQQTHDLDRLRQLLDQHPDLVHSTDIDGNGPLHHAVWFEQMEALELLLSRGAEIDLKRYDGLTPIMLSAWRSPKLTGYLLAQGAQCTLGAAASLGRLENVKQLIREDPQAVHGLDANGYAPMTYAAREGHTDVVQLFLDHGADPNRPEYYAWYGAALFEACLNDRRPVIKLLLDHGANANAGFDSSGWCLDRYSGGENVRQWLRDHGAIVQPMEMDISQMKDAIRRGDPIICDEKWTQFASWGSVVFTIVRKHHDIELLDLYVEKVGADGLCHLDSHVLYSTNPAFIDRLAFHGVDLNVRDWLGRNVLFQCACS